MDKLYRKTLNNLRKYPLFTRPDLLRLLFVWVYQTKEFGPNKVSSYLYSAQVNN